MYDAAPLQIIAHGIVPLTTVPGAVDAPFTEGVALIERSGVPGVTLIFLDGGLPGGGAVAPSDVRFIICPFFNPSFSIAFDVVGPTTVPSPAPPGVDPGTSVFSVRMRDSTTGNTVDNSYMFIVMRVAQSEST
jgi:hypothetical protein